MLRACASSDKISPIAWMIVRTLQEARQSARAVVSPGGEWESIRMLLKDDNMGFSFHITIVHEGANLKMHYQQHLESVYCITGQGEVETLADHAVYPIRPGTLYVLDQHDKHVLRAFEQMQLACVFNPALHGGEVHNAEGSYELPGESASVGSYTK